MKIIIEPTFKSILKETFFTKEAAKAIVQTFGIIAPIAPLILCSSLIEIIAQNAKTPIAIGEMPYHNPSAQYLLHITGMLMPLVILGTIACFANALISYKDLIKTKGRIKISDEYFTSTTIIPFLQFGLLSLSYHLYQIVK